MNTIVENVTCTFCGCLCDDIIVEVEDSRIVRVRRVCANGRGIFVDYDPTPRRPTVAGREVDWQEAIVEAVMILDRADSPLIYGLSSTAIEAQRKAVELADRLGAIIDTTSSVCHGPTGLAMHRSAPLLGLQSGRLSSAPFQAILNNVQGYTYTKRPPGSHRFRN
jgi:formylmethanofuran dehydrogenase subunit B